jgi:hypothetical protein
MVSDVEIIPVANNSAPKNVTIKLTSNQKVICDRSAITPIKTPTTGRINNKKVPT